MISSPNELVYTDPNSLTRGYTADELEIALYAEMKQFGPCYVKAKTVHFGNMPLAFVQYEVSGCVDSNRSLY